MGDQRKSTQRVEPRQRRRRVSPEPPFEDRRRNMQALEGHSGSTPRGNPEQEDETTWQREGEWDRVLGH